MQKLLLVHGKQLRRLGNQAVLIKTLTYGQNPVGKKAYLGRKRASTSNDRVQLYITDLNCLPPAV